jgi:signal transduction histidine kinase
MWLNLMKAFLQVLMPKEKIIKVRTQELEKSIEMKDILFSIIAHDLRNPCNAILGYSDLLSRNIRDIQSKKLKIRLKLSIVKQ